MAKRTTFPTPIGVLVYPRVFRPDTKFVEEGQYSTKLRLAPDGKGVPEFLKKIKGLQADSLAAAKKERPKAKSRGDCWEVDEDGSLVFHFKLKAKVTPRKGDAFEQRPAVFDASMKPVPPTVMVGGGSTAKCSIEPVFYDGFGGAGLSLRLRGVQIIELVEYEGGASASALGFGEEDGYEASSAMADQADDEDEGEEDETEAGGDF